MHIPVNDAGTQLIDLVRRAEAGEEIILTRAGQAVARLTSVKRRLSPAERIAIIEEAQRLARGKATPGPDAARSQDFLYDESGMPG